MAIMSHCLATHWITSPWVRISASHWIPARSWNTGALHREALKHASEWAYSASLLIAASGQCPYGPLIFWAYSCSMFAVNGLAAQSFWGLISPCLPQPNFWAWAARFKLPNPHVGFGPLFWAPSLNAYFFRPGFMIFHSHFNFGLKSI